MICYSHGSRSHPQCLSASSNSLPIYTEQKERDGFGGGGEAEPRLRRMNGLTLFRVEIGVGDMKSSG